jgi:hypothetical protein
VKKTNGGGWAVCRSLQLSRRGLASPSPPLPSATCCCACSIQPLRRITATAFARFVGTLVRVFGWSALTGGADVNEQVFRGDPPGQENSVADGGLRRRDLRADCIQSLQCCSAGAYRCIWPAVRHPALPDASCWLVASPTTDGSAFVCPPRLALTSQRGSRRRCNPMRYMMWAFTTPVMVMMVYFFSDFERSYVRAPSLPNDCPVQQAHSLLLRRLSHSRSVRRLT